MYGRMRLLLIIKIRSKCEQGIPVFVEYEHLQFHFSEALMLRTNVEVSSLIS